MSSATENGQEDVSSFGSTSPHKIHCTGNMTGTGNSHIYWDRERERKKNPPTLWGESSSRAGLTPPEGEKVSGRGPSPAPDTGAKFKETLER